METESHYLSVIRVWAALAWADGVIQPAEATAIRRLISRAPMLSAEEREAALGFLQQKVELQPETLTGFSPQLRAGVYRAALQLAHVDKDFAEEERSFLQRLRQALDLDQATVAQIEQAITKA